MLEKLPALSPLTVTSPGSPPNEAMLSWTQARAASCQHFIHHAMSQPKQHISIDDHRTHLVPNPRIAGHIFRG